MDYGSAAPLVFIGIQVAQVVLAPVPGEATGFVGGYLFGALYGCLYSSIGLFIGSVINFFLGRFFGQWVLRIWMPRQVFEKINRSIGTRGTAVVFFLFIFPGFPKDYLSLFLGVSKLPLKHFLWLSGIGRLPGTLMLSLQGAMLFEQNYILLAALTGVCLLAVIIAYTWRDRM